MKAKLIIEQNSKEGFPYKREISGFIESISSEMDLPYRQTAYRIKLVELDPPTYNYTYSTVTTENKEKKNMSVKIKKQPIEISLEELRKGEEYEKIIIHIDKEKKEELENRYGLKYNFYEKIDINDSELDFKEHYIRITETNKVTLPYNIPYDLIKKIEIVEK